MTTSGRALLDGALRAFEARDRDRAAALLGRLDVENPPLGDSWRAVARLAATLGEVNLAISAIRKYVALAPYDADRRLAYGGLLASSGRVQAAVDTTRAFLPHAGPDSRLSHLIGTGWAQLGETDLALESLREALTQSPDLALAAVIWLTIADLKRFVAGDPDVAAMETLLARTAGNDAQVSALLYALAKAHDDIGDTATAFSLYERGAALVRPTRPFPAAPSRAFVDQVEASLTASRFADLPPSLVECDRPIFVLGLPRSGTTLVEQILVTHSAVANGAELNLFTTATMALEGYSPGEIDRFAQRSGSGRAWTAFGEAYRHLLEERFGTEGRVVDKTLNHSRFLGLIKHVLPNARFIWVRRDPGDTALSCFRTHFAEGVNWSWSLADIGRHFADEDRLYRHWMREYPEAILSVNYEDLVTDPDHWNPIILGHCGLEMEPAIRHAHLSKRAVATASANQVRQPMHSRSIGGWRRYAEQLKPFFEAYGAPPLA